MKKAIKTLALTGGILCAVKGLDNRLEVTHYNISSPKIPKNFDGFKILQISDYHCDAIPGIVSETHCEMPDIIVSTGDLADDDGSYEPAIRLCEQLLKIAPVYAVNGNHDVWRADYKKFDRELADTGVRTLHNERIQLESGGERIGLCGIDDPLSNDEKKFGRGLEKSLSQLPPYQGYDILLFHRANMFDMIKQHGFDLVLAGHMHGGQIRLPSGRGIVAPKSAWTGKASMFFPKYVGGHYRYGDTEMIVSRGLGNPMIIPRLFNRPEITVITLRHGDGYDK